MFTVRFSGIDAEAASNHFYKIVGTHFRRTDIEFNSDWDREENTISYGEETDYGEFCEIFCSVALDILQNEVEFSMEALFDGRVKAQLFVCYSDGTLTANKEIGSNEDEADFDVEDGYIATDYELNEFGSFFKE